MSFAHPEGPLGVLAAHLMAVAGRRRSLEVLRRLSLEPGDRVLEIGFGAGEAIARACDFTGDVGSVTGVDSSQTMVKRARRRFSIEISQGRVSIVHGSADDPLPFDDRAFTKVFSINSFQFWGDPPAALREIRRVMAPEGKVILAVQPRGDLARLKTPTEVLEALASALEAARFELTDQDLFTGTRIPVAIAQAIRR